MRTKSAAVTILLGVLLSGCGGEKISPARQTLSLSERGPSAEVGIAIQRNGFVELIPIDGSKGRRLVGFSLHERSYFGLFGPLRVERDGELFTVDSATLELEPVAEFPIELGGERLLGRGEGGYTVEEHGKTVIALPPGVVEMPRVARGGRVLTAVNFFPQDGEFRVRAFDLVDGTWRDLPDRCTAVAKRGRDLYMTCDESDDNAWVTLETLNGSRNLLEPAVEQAALSPDGESFIVLDEFNPPTAFLPIEGGERVPIASDARFANAQPLGWAQDGRAIVLVGAGGNCPGKPKAGVYLVSRDGKPELFRAIPPCTDVAVWRHLRRR